MADSKHMNEDPHPEFTGSPEKAFSQAQSAATQELKHDHDAAIERRLSRAQLQLKEIVIVAEKNGGDGAVLLDWQHDYLELIKITSMSRQVFEWLYETTNGIHKSVREDKEKMTQRTSIIDSTPGIKPKFAPHIKVNRAILKTEGEVWYQELSTFLHNLQEYVHARIVDQRAPYIGSREDYKGLEKCFDHIKDVLLPSEHRKELVPRKEWYRRFHAMIVIKELVKRNQPVIGESGVTPEVRKVLALMNSWTPPSCLLLPVKTNKQDSLRKFSPIGRKEVTNRF